MIPSGLTVDRLLPAPDHIILITRSTGDRAACPLCHQPSARVHSSYSRRLADLPWQGRILYLHLRVRRFRCANRDCRRRIFAERPALTQPKARRTLRLREIPNPDKL
jgi:transposase